MVQLKGRSMSGRRGEYYTVDELIEDYKVLVQEEYLGSLVRRLGSSRVGSIDLDWLGETAEKLAVANTRCLLVSTDPRKVLVFDPSRLREHLEGSWILYTYVRLQGILRKKYGYEPLDNISRLEKDLSMLKESVEKAELTGIEKELVETIAGYPEILLEAWRSMEPNRILEYTLNLSAIINNLYESLPVLGEKDTDKRNTRILLVGLSLLMLRDAISILRLPETRRI
jgi:arginyl-tRNA synthetase